MARKRRYWVIVGAAMFLLIVTAGFAAMIYSAPIVATAVDTALTRAGIPHDDIGVRAISLRGVTLAPVRLGENRDLTAEAVTVLWSFSGLRARRADHVRIERARVKAAFVDGTLSIAGLPQSPDGGGAIALPFSRLELVEADISVDAAPATARIIGNISLRTGDEISVRGDIDVSADLDIGGAPQSFEVKFPNLGATLVGREFGVMASEIVAATPYGAAELEVRAVADLGNVGTAKAVLSLAPASAEAASWPRLDVTIESRRDGEQILFSGEADIANDSARVRYDGRHDLADGNGNLYFRVLPVRFSPEGLQPGDFSTAIPAFLKDVTGRIQGELAVAYRRGAAPRFSSSAKLDAFGFDTGIARLSDLHGTIDLSELTPPKTKLPQKIEGTVHVDPIPPMPFDLTFGLPGDGSMNVDGFFLEALGGNVSLEDLSVAPSRPIETEIRIARADVGAVLALVDVEGLSGSGTMSGSIPVRVDRTEVDIDDGSLVSDGPGVLRYTGRGLDEAARAAGGSSERTVNLLRQALSDFHYDKLTLGIDRDRTGQGVLSVRLAGKNPAVLDGYPFNININLETNFDNLAAVLLDGYAAADRLMRRGVGR